MKLSIDTKTQSEGNRFPSLTMPDKTVCELFEICMALPAALGAKFWSKVELVRVAFVYDYQSMNDGLPEVSVIWLDPSDKRREVKERLPFTFGHDVTKDGRVKLICRAIRADHKTAMKDCKWTADRLGESAPI